MYGGMQVRNMHQYEMEPVYYRRRVGLGGRTWGTLWMFSIAMLILLSMYSSMMEDMEQMRQMAEPPPLIDKPYHLPAYRRLDTATPILLSYSHANAIHAINAASASGLLPKEGLTLLTLTASANLWPPDQSDRYGGAAKNDNEILGKQELQLAAVLQGHVDRVFTVTPAPDLRELLLVNGGDVTFRHITRAEPEKSQCTLARREEALWVFSNSSLHHTVSDVPHAFSVGSKMQSPVGVHIPHTDDPSAAFAVETAMELTGGKATVCCEGCLRPDEGRAAGGEDEGGDEGGELVVGGEGGEEGFEVQGGAGVVSGKKGAVKYFAWHGELADADREAEVAFDADQLTEAMAPLGPYVVAVDYSFFTDPASASPPHPTCRWLVREDTVEQCVLPLANARGDIGAAERYVAGLTNIALAAISNRQPPTQMPVACLRYFKDFRYFFWKALNRENKMRLAVKHPPEAVGEMCGLPDMRPLESTRRTWARETREVQWMHRRVETLRKFLQLVQKRLRAPSLLLLAKAPSAFSLVPSSHSLIVQHDMLEALKSLRRFSSDFTLLNAEYDYERSD